MSWEDIVNIIIVLCIILIIILFIITIPILYNWIFIPDSVTEVQSNITSTSTALIVALISIIALLITRKQTNKSITLTNETIRNNKKFNDETLRKTEEMIKYNEKTLRLTNESLNQNEDIMYVQLRFHDAEKSLYNLQNELINAWTIYNELLELKSKETYFNPRGFIIAQYTIWEYDLDLLEHIPLGLKKSFLSMSPTELSENPLKFMEYFNALNSFKKEDFEKYKPLLKSYFEFNQFMEKFNANCISGRFISSFKELYESEINAETIINFIIQTESEIRQRSVEDFIFEEKLLKINHRSMIREINENNSNK